MGKIPPESVVFPFLTEAGRYDLGQNFCHEKK
jgi:hypothetical protein